MNRISSFLFLLAVAALCLTNHAGNAQNVQSQAVDSVETSYFRAFFRTNGSLVASRILSGEGREQKHGLWVRPLDSTNHRFMEAILDDGLWFGARDANDRLHLAVKADRSAGTNDFFPGPLKPGLPVVEPDEDIFLRHDRIHVISRQRIDDFLATLSDERDVSEFHEILEWPATEQNGYEPLAPFVDLNRNGLYEPQLGEYPEIMGDHMAWWVINDAAAPHTEGGTDPLRVEVHVSAFYFDVDSESDPHYGRLYFRIRCHNRSGQSYPQFIAGLFSDIDVGFFADDYMGTDSTTHLAYCYNGISHQGAGASLSFAVGYQVLKSGAIDTRGYDQGLRAALFYWDYDDAVGNPTEPSHYWNILNGKWRDGSALVDDRRFNGNGFLDPTESQCPPARFHYPDLPGSISTAENPHQYWHEAGSGNDPFDRRIFMSLGSSDLRPNHSRQIDLAVLWAFGEADSTYPRRYTEVKMLREIAHENQYSYDLIYRPHRPTSRPFAKNAPAPAVLFPCPTDGPATILNLPAGRWSAEVLDLSGRSLLRTSGETEAGKLSLDLSALPDGVYAVRLTGANGQSRYARAVKMGR